MIQKTALAAALCSAALVSLSRADDQVRIEPTWEYATRPRLVVVPVQIDMRAAGPRAAEAAGSRATQALEEWLKRCGAFDLAERRTGQDVAQNFHLARVWQTPVGQTALPGQLAAGVDAIVICTLTSAAVEIAPQRVQRERYQVEDDKLERDSLNRPIVIGREDVTIVRKVGRAGGVVQVLDAQTGQVLLRHETAPIEIVHEGIAPDTRVESNELAEKAGEQLGIDWARQVGPTVADIDFDNDQLVLATGWIEDRYDEIDDVFPGQGQFTVAVRNLPPAAARLPFVLSIMDDDDKAIWTQGFAWTDDGRPARGHAFVVPVQVLKDSGQGKFELQLFAPGLTSPVASNGFDLDEP